MQGLLYPDFSLAWLTNLWIFQVRLYSIKSLGCWKSLNYYNTFCINLSDRQFYLAWAVSRDMSSPKVRLTWWLQMPWHQKGARASATTMLTLLCHGYELFLTNDILFHLIYWNVQHLQSFPNSRGAITSYGPVPVNDLVLRDARTSAGAVMTRHKSCIYQTGAWNGWYWPSTSLTSLRACICSHLLRLKHFNGWSGTCRCEWSVLLWINSVAPGRFQ